MDMLMGHKPRPEKGSIRWVRQFKDGSYMNDSYTSTMDINEAYLFNSKRDAIGLWDSDSIGTVKVRVRVRIMEERGR